MGFALLVIVTQVMDTVGRENIGIPRKWIFSGENITFYMYLENAFCK